MRAVVITGPGGPEVLRIEDRPAPEPGPYEVRVRIRSSALNRADLLQRRGRYPAPAGFPADIPGLEFAGEIDAAGPGAARWALGDRVMGIIGGGAHAELLCIHQDELMSVPAALDWPSAGAVPEAFLTAYDALFRQADLGAGEKVVIHAVGSGVGTAALQLALAAGADVCGTSRSSHKLNGAERLGLPYGVLSTGDWTEQVRDWAGPVGVNVVLDLVGGPFLGRSVELLASRGRIMAVGMVAGTHSELDLGLLLRKRAHLIGTVLRSRSSAERIDLVREFQQSVIPLLASGRVGPVIEECYPFTRIADAHRRLEGNDTFGKLALLW